MPNRRRRRSTLNREQLRQAFEEVPELYDRARPAYPAEVFDDLVELAGIPAGGRILEIGPGTGKATRPLAERGFRIVAVELGPRLAGAARGNLAGLDVEIVNATFEDWDPAEAGFDAVVAFTAFHWIDPEVRFLKAAELLRPGGALAVVETHHVLPAGGDGFFADVQEDYEAVDPSEDNRPPGPPEDVPDLSGEIDASGVFCTVAVRRHVWFVTYSADEYVAVLDTYSGHRSLEKGKRLELYERIHRRIESRPEGRVHKHYLATLNVARKL